MLRARNFGTDAAQGEWIAYLDDDAEWLPEKLERQLAEAEAIGEDDVLIVCKYIERSPSGERIWPETLPTTADRNRFSEYMFLHRGQLLPSTYFVSAALAQRIQFDHIAGVGVEDPDWILRLAADPNVRIGAVDAPLAFYNNMRMVDRDSLRGKERGAATTTEPSPGGTSSLRSPSPASSSRRSCSRPMMRAFRGLRSSGS